MPAAIISSAALCGACLALAFALRRERLRRLGQPLRLQAVWRHLWQRWEAWLAPAYLPVSATQSAALGGAALLLLGLLAWRRWGFLAFLAMLCTAGWLLPWFRRRRIAARGRRVAAELPAFLRLVIAAVRSGFSLLQALTMAAREGPPLLAQEMQRVIYEVNVGAPLATALEHLAGRLGDDDIDFFVAAVLLSREAGGNLSETLRSLLRTVEARLRLRRSIRVLTAQARLSGTIVALLPFFMVLIISLINPEYTRVLFVTPMGWLLLAISLVMEGIGVWLIRRMIRAGEDLLS